MGFGVRLKRAALSPGSGLEKVEGLAVLDRLGVLAKEPHQGAGGLGIDLVHQLHGFDDADGLAHLDLGALLDEGAAVGGSLRQNAHQLLNLLERQPPLTFAQRILLKELFVPFVKSCSGFLDYISNMDLPSESFEQAAPAELSLQNDSKRID